MWLLNVITLELEEFIGGSIPPYGILSHTWDEDEVSFTEMQRVKYEPGVARKAGFRKIVGCCASAKNYNLMYAWIDSCCIDKRSSAELSEAVNSMYQWYRDARHCYVFLSDVTKNIESQEELRKSRWFTPGWTLQELLAPRELLFFAADWTVVGYLRKATKAMIDPAMRHSNALATLSPNLDLSDIISNITEIPLDFLVGRKTIAQACLAQRMYWASRRETTRAEDRAYSLMGLFDISMPIIYGEGLPKAFNRLQREIINRSPDQSILAWYDARGSSHQLLATSPESFSNSGAVTQMARSQSLVLETSTNWSSFAMTNLGLRITLPLSIPAANGRLRYGESAKAALHCVATDRNGNLQRVHLDLIFLNNDLEGQPIFMCHRSREWTFGVSYSYPAIMFLCGNDYISALAEQKIDPPAKAVSHNDIAHHFMTILEEEAGISEMDIVSKDTLLTDLGVDSLLSLMISARVRGELNKDIGLDILDKTCSVGSIIAFLESTDSSVPSKVLPLT